MPKKHTQSTKTRKRKGKDLDQIVDDLRPEKAAKLLNQPVDLEVAGDAQFYCIECNRYFVDETTINGHRKTKVHKRRLKQLEVPPYTVAEAEAAGGVGVYDRDRFLGPSKLSKKKPAFDSAIEMLRPYQLTRLCRSFATTTSDTGRRIGELSEAYTAAKTAVETFPPLSKVDPRAVFANNELNLGHIDVYGFDYDYTLAVYTRSLNQLIYDLAMNRLITYFKYPEQLRNIPYDITWAVRGLHFDAKKCVLLKLDAFSQIQKGTVYRGKVALPDEMVRKMYKGFSVSYDQIDPMYNLNPERETSLRQLIDLFTLPWVGLLTTATEYFDTHKIDFDPLSLFQDVEVAVQSVHLSGEMYSAVTSDLPQYVHKNPGLKEFLERLHKNGKVLFMITNSPYSFMNTGMHYMLGPDWREYFKYIVVLARKPKFFNGSAPFRLYNEVDDSLSYEKVTQLQPGFIYAGGNMQELAEKAAFDGRGVLFFGDHIYTDLADPMLKLGWHTGAIVPELAREIRTQNMDNYRSLVCWLETLTSLIEKFQDAAQGDPAVERVLQEWIKERSLLRTETKNMFNPQFGSIFRTYHNMTYFSRRLMRLADVYTSRLPNMLKYGLDHTFYPRRYPLPHEPHSPIGTDIF
uniref:Zinc finger protein 593 homolog n=1 Tax=Plectus sambesii TaxID=2011161 RepID=A0A914XAW7_9BILA